MPHFPGYILYLDRARLLGQNCCLLHLHISRPEGGPVAGRSFRCGLVVHPDYHPENTSGIGKTSFCTGTAPLFFQARIRSAGDLAL